MKKHLPHVTLFGLDCLNIDRLIQAAEICQSGIEFGAVKLLTSLESNNPDVVKIPPIIRSIEDYSHFMVHSLNSYIETEYVLVIQYDGFILNPSAWTDEYLKYDYIGAPWYDNGKFTVGNGGFSFRSKKLLEILQNDTSIAPIPRTEPEDTYICCDLRKYLESKGIRFAPPELASQFSLESNEMYGVEWTNQFGFHGLTWTDISNWLQAHPEYSIQNPLDEWAIGVKRMFKGV